MDEEVFDYESPAFKPEDEEASEPAVADSDSEPEVPVKRTKAIRGVYVDVETGRRYAPDFEGLAPNRLLDVVRKGRPAFVPAD